MQDLHVKDWYRDRKIPCSESNGRNFEILGLSSMLLGSRRSVDLFLLPLFNTRKELVLFLRIL